jgi:hypothetical protein
MYLAHLIAATASSSCGVEHVVRTLHDTTHAQTSIHEIKHAFQHYVSYIMQQMLVFRCMAVAVALVIKDHISTELLCVQHDYL